VSRGACCIYVADESTIEEVSDAFGAAGVDVAECRQRGSLHFLTKWEYRRQPELDTNVMSEVIGELLEQVSAGDWTGLWLVVEMTWTLAPEVEKGQLLKWEATLDSLLEGKPAVVLCLYNQNLMALADLDTALRTHPFLMGTGLIFPNPHYDPTDLILSPEDGLEQKVNWMLGHIQALQNQQQGQDELETAYRILASKNAGATAHRIEAGPETGPVYERILGFEKSIASIQQALPPELGQLLLPELAVLKAGLEELYISHEELLDQNQQLQVSQIALAEERQRYQELFELAPDGYLVTDPAGNIKEANQVLASLLRMSPKYLLGKPLVVLVAPEDQQEFRSQLQRSGSNRQTSEFETRIKPRFGEVIPVRLTVHPVWDLVEGETSLRWLVHDLTEQKRAAEERARDHEEIASYQEAFRQLSDGIEDFAIFLLDPSGHIVTWNHGAQDLKGYTADEIIGRHFSCFYIEEDVEWGKPQYLLEVAATRGSVEDEGWRVRKDGIRFWASVLITALRAPGGQPWGFAKVVRDLTERRRAEEDRIRLHELRLEEEERRRLQTLIDTSPVGVVVVDARTQQLVLVNREAQRLRGDSYQPGKPLSECGQDITYLSPDGCRWEREDLPLRRALNYGETVRAEEIIMEFPDGRTIPTLVNATPVYSEQGGIVSAISIMQDLTPLHELEKLRNEFLGMVTHELRTPLSTIKGAAATGLRSRIALRPGESQEFFKIIEEQVDHLTDLVNNLLDMTSIEAGVFTVTIEPIDLPPILEEAIGGFHHIQSKCLVECQIPEELPKVDADRRRVIQVLANLLDNAARFSPPGSPIIVELEHDAGYVTVHVRDSGPGLPEDKLPYLFKKFTRIDENSGSSGSGLGLGLAICQGIVEAHGGRIWATSSRGAGTTISFTLVEAVEVSIPSPAAASLDGVSVKGNGAPGERSKILAVDDDHNALRFLRRLLEDTGYLPIVSSNPEEVLEIVEAQRPDLVLLDVMLPQINGLDLMKSIREYSDVPVIFLTARDARDDMVSALKAGGDDYVTKPFSESELLARVEAILRRRANNGNLRTLAPYEFGGLTIDFDHRRVTVDGEEVSLSATEYKLISVLAQHAGRVMTHDQILQLVWGQEYYGETELVRSMVRRLRSKLGDNALDPRYIFTVAQVGYRMAAP
jgi:PAS domain S-box-containing protein